MISATARSRGPRLLNALTVIALSVITLTVTAGCSSGGGAAASEVSDEFDRTVAQAIDEARQAGASQEQMDVLVQAQQTREVGFEDAKQAALRTIECMEDFGGTGSYMVDHVALDFYLPAYTIGGDPSDFDDIDATIDECDQRESHWVLMLHQVQPKYEQARALELDERRRARIACVQALGVDVPDDATWEDVTGTIHDSADAQVANCAAN